MKIKLCPQCGKQNDVDAWNCADCGATLSMNTIAEVGDLSSLQVAIAGKGILSSVSPFFQDDLTELIKNNTRSSEAILKGCDICKSSILPPFQFGYIILTSQQLLCVCFASDIKPALIGGILPQRAWLRRYLGEFIEGSSAGVGSKKPTDFCFVNRPEYAITTTEKSSRELTAFPLETLYSVELVNDVFLKLKFRSGDGGPLVEFSVTFYFNDEAYEIYKSLTEKAK